MKNNMMKNLLWGAVKFGQGVEVDHTQQTNKELMEIMDGEFNIIFEHLSHYYDVSAEEGFKEANKRFPELVKRFPHVTKVLSIYLHA